MESVTEIASQNSIDSLLMELKALVATATNNIVSCSNAVCKLIDLGVDIEEIAEGADVPKTLVMSLERVGRNKLHASLVFADSPGKKALRLLPYCQQEKYLKEPMPLLISNGDTLNIHVDDLTLEQSAQLFNRGRIRPLHEQKAFIEGAKLRTAIKEVKSDLPYRIGQKQVAFLKPCTISIAELGRIITEAHS